MELRGLRDLTEGQRYKVTGGAGTNWAESCAKGCSQWWALFCWRKVSVCLVPGTEAAPAWPQVPWGSL